MQSVLDLRVAYLQVELHVELNVDCEAIQRVRTVRQLCYPHAHGVLLVVRIHESIQLLENGRVHHQWVLIGLRCEVDHLAHAVQEADHLPGGVRAVVAEHVEEVREVGGHHHGERVYEVRQESQYLSLLGDQILIDVYLALVLQLS